MKKISLIIPVFNTKTWNYICFDAIKRLANREEIEVIAVFNNCLGNIIDKVREYGIDKEIILESNFGCPEGFNIGAKNASCDLLCFAHTDTIFPKDFFSDAYNKFIEYKEDDDEAIVGICPLTNYTNIIQLKVTDDIVEKYCEYKHNNKSIRTKREVEDSIIEFYKSLGTQVNDGSMLDYINKFYDGVKNRNEGKFSFLSDISHFCFIVEKNIFNEMSCFDKEYFPIGFFEKDFLDRLIHSGYSVLALRDLYVHHNGNTTSDFFGFNLENILKNSEKLYHKKQDIRYLTNPNI